MYGDLSNKLILEAKRAKQLRETSTSLASQLTPYQETFVRNILKEVEQLKQNAIFLHEEIVNETDPMQLKMKKCQYYVNFFAMERNKRCLLAYHKDRSDTMDSLCWDQQNLILNGGNGNKGNKHDATTLDNNNNNDDNDNDNNSNNIDNETFDINNLSHEEQVYIREYSKLITSLNGDEFADIDLNGSLVPPSEVFIDVRVLKDAGEIQTEYGVFNLIKDSQFFVRQSDVERLIQQGYLKKI
ncbi:related to DNA replication complex GINS protein PSF1 [Saccharomycodes ludwigii]|uniref:DNA replication complex GINS protein PSF1 n=1 Tax=Saccharomycodes ludwigii TaxID=36035 RepID=A0A376B6S9_9ASCO|nr:related to DNA replication complex GINS protein PSF1 [Saccharomycodes ludwigii]